MAFFCRVTLVASCVLFIGTMAALAALYPYPALLVAGLCGWKWLRRGRPAGWVHGTARLSGWGDVLHRNLAGENGLILGTTGYLSPPSRRMAFGQLLTAPLRNSLLAVKLFLGCLWGRGWSDNHVIRVSDYVHLASFASTGGGKGVSVVLPTLLSYRGSVVVTDPKSENLRIVGEHRRKKFGHRIIRLEPFGTHSDTFNPLDTIDENAPDFIDQCRDLAVALVVRTGKETETHFLDSAERVLQAFIAFVCACQADREMRNLQTVRQLLADRGKFEMCVKIMQDAGDVAGGMLQRLGSSLSWHQDRELASVLSTVQRVTGFLDTPPIAANTLKSSFHPDDLRDGKTSIFLCLPPRRLKSHAALQRMWINCILGTIIKNADETKPVLFILDEIGNMGRLPMLEDAVTLMRGMGIRLWFIFQSLNQVKECFGDNADTFLDNIGTKQFFAIRSFETAEAISKQAGEATVFSVSDQEGESSSRPTGTGDGPNGPGPGSVGSSSSLTTSEIARKLMLPNEITTMPNDLALVFHQNMQVLPVKLLKYYNAAEFKRGRTGRSRGLGLAGGLAAVMTLLVSFSLPTVAAGLLKYVQRHAGPVLRAAAGGPGVNRQAGRPYGGNRYRSYPAYPNRLRRYARSSNGY
jgi:type IV secretion system protein VirD4